jgi:HCOMODA/2-hydroxy-3-carboxy-muconic semialdehyde decarboxylase
MQQKSLGDSNGAAITSKPSDLVLANRILASFGIVDAFGHISMRSLDRPDRFIMSESRSPELVTDDDLITFNFECEPIDGGDRRLYAERAIHGRIYAARPDVFAVCHNHSLATIPFGTTGVPLRPIFHVAAGIGNHIPVWDSEEEFGPTDMLVRGNDMGDSLARKLGDARVVLMRGHGATVVGSTLKEMVFTSIYMQKNSEALLHALALGNVKYMSDEEIELTRRSNNSAL